MEFHNASVLWRPLHARLDLDVLEPTLEAYVGVYIESREYRGLIGLGSWSRRLTKAISERLVKSFLDLFILDLLNGGAKHGYEVMRELRSRTGTRIGAGTLYPLLYELEERQLVTGEWVSPTRRSRRVYKITDKGTKYREQGFKGIELLLKGSSVRPNLSPYWNG